MKEQLFPVFRRRQISQLVKHYGIHLGKPPAFSRNLLLLKLIDRVYMIVESGPFAGSNLAEGDCSGQVCSCTSAVNKEAAR